MYAVGIDIGGTKVALALVNQNGQLIKEARIPTDLSLSPALMIERINDTVEQLLFKQNFTHDQLIGIGLGAPGPLNSKQGIITNPPNLTGWINVPIVDYMKKRFNLPIRLENDANAAALAEKWLGAAQENQEFVYMTISTGIGAGIFANGELITGARGNAGDFGHTVIDPSFGQCTCGQYGCLEHIASGTAIARKGSEIAGEKLTTAEVFQRFHKDDPLLAPFVKSIFTVLGTACVSLINTFDPEKIVIGGGVSKVGDILFKGMADYVKQFALNPEGKNTEIVPAKLDQDAGVIGAAALILQSDQNKGESSYV